MLLVPPPPPPPPPLLPPPLPAPRWVRCSFAPSPVGAGALRFFFPGLAGVCCPSFGSASLLAAAATSTSEPSVMYCLQLLLFSWAHILSSWLSAGICSGRALYSGARSRSSSPVRLDESPPRSLFSRYSSTMCDSNEDDGMNPTPSSPLRAQPRGISGGRARANKTRSSPCRWAPPPRCSASRRQELAWMPKGRRAGLRATAAVPHECESGA